MIGTVAQCSDCARGTNLAHIAVLRGPQFLQVPSGGRSVIEGPAAGTFIDYLSTSQASLKQLAPLHNPRFSRST
jgi:hypothetical protein